MRSGDLGTPAENQAVILWEKGVVLFEKWVGTPPTYWDWATPSWLTVEPGADSPHSQAMLSTNAIIANPNRVVSWVRKT